MTYAIHDKSLFDYTAGVYCGVLVEEHVMKKLAKVQAQHVEKVKRILNDNIDSVYPSMWTLHYPNGEQTNVNFIDTSADLETRINNAVMMRQPEHCPLVFIAGSMDEARNMANERFEELGGA